MTNNALQAKFQPRKTRDGSNTLYSLEYRQTFHSIHGALTETEHVFLKGTGVRQRLEAGQPTHILEVGFGTGLNFLATANDGRKYQTAVHYVALENALLPAQLLARLNYGRLFPSVQDIWQAFLTWRGNLPDPLTLAAASWKVNEHLQLELILGNAAHISIPHLDFQAVYHDAFSPEANPELWTQDFFARLYEVMTPGGKLATYSVKGAVRRNLQAVGFQVRKLPGPPGKREMLVAVCEKG